MLECSAVLKKLECQAIWLCRFLGQKPLAIALREDER
jgi:hypothetical protein